MKRTLPLSLLACLLLSSAPAMAQESFLSKVNGWFSNFFATILNDHPDEDPTESGIAPFAHPDDVRKMSAIERQKGSLENPNQPLDQPHRSSRELEVWVQQALSEILSFNADTYALYQEHVFPRGIAPSGVTELTGWIQSSELVETLRENGMQLNAFVMERPTLLNEGNVNGRYRWLFEAPMMISFVPRGTRVYDPAQAMDTRTMTVTLQIGRVQESLLEHNVMIETWSVRNSTR